MTFQISQPGNECLRTARTLLRAAQTMTDELIAGQLKALADDYERRAEKARLLTRPKLWPALPLSLNRSGKTSRGLDWSRALKRARYDCIFPPADPLSAQRDTASVSRPVRGANGNRRDGGCRKLRSSPCSAVSCLQQIAMSRPSSPRTADVSKQSCLMARRSSLIDEAASGRAPGGVAV